MNDEWYAGYVQGIKDGEEDTRAYLLVALYKLKASIVDNKGIAESTKVIALASIQIFTTMIIKRTYYPK